MTSNYPILYIYSNICLIKNLVLSNNPYINYLPINLTVSLNQSHQHHHNAAHPTSALKASVTRVGHTGGGHHGLGPRKANWQAEGGAANVAVSRKNSLLMQTANSCGVSNLGRGTIALHCGKIQPGGSTINLSSVDLTSYIARCQVGIEAHRGVAN